MSAKEDAALGVGCVVIIGWLLWVFILVCCAVILFRAAFLGG